MLRIPIYQGVLGVTALELHLDDVHAFPSITVASNVFFDHLEAMIDLSQCEF